MRHGYGVHKCINGDVYRGQWRLNKRHGNGRMVFKSGLEYDVSKTSPCSHPSSLCSGILG